MSETDTILLQKIKNDDKAALEETYAKYRSAFLMYMSRYQLNREDVLDIYQDAIIDLYQNLVVRNVELKNNNLKSYLFGIGKNKIFDRFKELKKKREYEPQLETFSEIKLPDNQPTERQKLLAQHFSKLGESCREILKMYYYRGLTIKEMVELSHYKDENTVKSHKSRCLKKLKNAIKAQL